MKINQILKEKLASGATISLIAILLAVAAACSKTAAKLESPPDVEVVQVQQKDVPIYGEWIGTLDGLVNADVRAQVTGYLLKQGYQEGRFVKQGQLLFQIDPRPFQAALDHAQGQLGQETAMLANSQESRAHPDRD